MHTHYILERTASEGTGYYMWAASGAPEYLYFFYDQHAASCVLGTAVQYPAQLGGGCCLDLQILRHQLLVYRRGWRESAGRAVHCIGPVAAHCLLLPGQLPHGVRGYLCQPLFCTNSHKGSKPTSNMNTIFNPYNLHFCILTIFCLIELVGTALNACTLTF